MINIFPTDMFRYNIKAISYNRDEDSARLFVEAAQGVVEEHILDLVNDPNISSQFVQQLIKKVRQISYLKYFVDNQQALRYFLQEKNFAPGLIMFLASTLDGDGCLSPDLSPYNRVMYHNGSSTYPDIGDIIYEDSQATIRAEDISSPKNYQMLNGEYLETDSLGQRVALTCP